MGGESSTLSPERGRPSTGPSVALRIPHHEIKRGTKRNILPSYVEPFDWVTPGAAQCIESDQKGTRSRLQLCMGLIAPLAVQRGRAVRERRRPNRVGRPASPICTRGFRRRPCITAVRSRFTSGDPVKPSSITPALRGSNRWQPRYVKAMRDFTGRSFPSGSVRYVPSSLTVGGW